MKKALLLYSSIDGQAFAIISKIALRIAEQSEDIHYEIYDLEQLPKLNLVDYSSVLIGASSRCNKFDKFFLKYIKTYHKALNDMKTAFFSVNLTARKTDKNTPETNDCTKKFLVKSSWHPNLVAVFAGSLRYPCFPWYDKIISKSIMRLKGEKHRLNEEYDYTDWHKVDEFAKAFIMLTRQA